MEYQYFKSNKLHHQKGSNILTTQCILLNVWYFINLYDLKKSYQTWWDVFQPLISDMESQNTMATDIELTSGANHCHAGLIVLSLCDEYHLDSHHPLPSRTTITHSHHTLPSHTTITHYQNTLSQPGITHRIRMPSNTSHHTQSSHTTSHTQSPTGLAQMITWSHTQYSICITHRIK